ncbi:MAG: hypothetical protein K6B41_10635 [Butyrivibrio sp.]|nr:hypothetical protein [Butyrivibrio sp.]
MYRLSEKKTVKTIITAMLFCFLLVGCGTFNPADAEVSTISIDKEENITSVVVDSFEQDYYDLEELRTMINSEISSFNIEYGEGCASLEDLTQEDGQVKMVMKYSSASNYSHFNQIALFYGTVSEALMRGYDLSVDFYNTDGEQVSAEDISSLSEQHIVITADNSNIDTPYKIKYMTSGVTLNGSSEAILPETSDGNVYLILEK